MFFRGYHGIDEMRLYALSGISVEEELEDYLKIRQRFAEQQMIFVHQTSFQRHLLKRYGNHVCFLDPVYRTIKYPLPLYFLMVKTNVDYQAVATFVVQDENMESTKEALEFIKVWNPEWKPKVFMVDNDGEEILALEEVFTGTKLQHSLPSGTELLKIKFLFFGRKQSLHQRLPSSPSLGKVAIAIIQPHDTLQRRHALSFAPTGQSNVLKAV